MNFPLWPLLLAAFAGITMAFQGALNASLGKAIGSLESTLMVHLIGTATVAIPFLIFKGGKGGLANLDKAPWYTLLGGVLGVIIVASVMLSIPKAGVANATTAIIIGQVITAMAIDHFGLFGLEQVSLSWWDGLGLLFLAAGGYLLLGQ